MTLALTPGFADPVTDAQQCFRAVLDAMARPGRIHDVGGVTPPAPLSVAAAAVLLTIVDHETLLWLDPQLLGPTAGTTRDWIAFHCGAPMTAEPTKAAFGLALSLPDLTRFAAGTHEAPETSATIIVQLPALSGGRALRLSGPGLRDSAILAPVGLPPDFAQLWQHNRGRFPVGVDLILCADAHLTALPRTVMIEEV